MPMTASPQFLRSQAGFSLIEVLVALFILAVGMLGMTSLQNEALKYNQAAFLDSQAQFLLADMVERIRANPGASTYVIDFTEDESTPAVNCAAATCTSAQMAAWDIAQWRGLVEDNAYLPSGESAISYVSATRTYTLSVRYEWSHLGNTDASGEKRTLTISTRI